MLSGCAGGLPRGARVADLVHRRRPAHLRRCARQPARRAVSVRAGGGAARGAQPPARRLEDRAIRRRPRPHGAARGALGRRPQRRRRPQPALPLRHARRGRRAVLRARGRQRHRSLPLPAAGEPRVPPVPWRFDAMPRDRLRSRLQADRARGGQRGRHGEPRDGRPGGPPPRRDHWRRGDRPGRAAQARHEERCARHAARAPRLRPSRAARG